ncbi:MAG: 16S rRNA (uracil(1498)-N(3))-methyltransferase [Proteobacteria bacterium]|nr:16S rRNA (uracil(1498)-N(3))-methyltransferase [Pseudomonadota bacterium]
MAALLRLFIDTPLAAGQTLALADGAARHVQVWRLQPGDALVLFNGQGGQWTADVVAMGRREVTVRVGAHQTGVAEGPRAVTLAVGVPTGERMDTLVEKATELGVARIQPLICTRSVLRLTGERAAKRRAHWQGVAQAAAEQSGRCVVPQVADWLDLADWLPQAQGSRHVLSLAGDAVPLASWAGPVSVTLLSGPEGGLTPDEEARARQAGFTPASLGPRVLRADTAPLAALALLQLLSV